MKFFKLNIEIIECPYCKGSDITEEGTECPWCNGVGLFKKETEVVVEEEDGKRY